MAIWMTNNDEGQEEGDEASVLFCGECYKDLPVSEIRRLERTPGQGFRAMTPTEVSEEMGCLMCDECGLEE